MEEQKNKKIWKILKISILILLAIGLLIIGIKSCVKTNALESIENYNIYTNVGQIDYISNTDTIYTIEFTNDRIYYYYNGNFEYQEQYAHYTFYFDSNDLENEISDTLKIEITELQIGTIVFFGGFVDIEEDAYYINRITTITRYLDALTNTTYSNGYVAAADTNNPNSPFNQGVAKGKEEINQQYQSQLEQKEQEFNKALQQAQSESQAWRELYESGTTPWGSFKALCGMIVTFPIKWFKEGLDVNVFGVNVGGFIIGIGIIIIILTIIGIFKGRGAKND